MTKKTTASSNAGKAIAIGAGVAAIAGAAYFFLGPKGKKHQKAAKGWMIKMKGEVIEKLETLQEVTEPIYDRVVDSVAEQYAKQGKIGKAELAAIAKELKGHWKTIAKSAKSGAKTVTKTVKSSVKEAQS